MDSLVLMWEHGRGCIAAGGRKSCLSWQLQDCKSHASPVTIWTTSSTLLLQISVYISISSGFCAQRFFWGQVKIMQKRLIVSLNYKDSLCVYIWSSSPSSAKEKQTTPNFLWSLLPLHTILNISEAVEWLCTRAALCVISLWSQWSPIVA